MGRIISFSVKGDFSRTSKFLKTISTKSAFGRLDGYARRGVDALASATPVDSGLTAESWDYEIKQTKNYTTIIWTNSNIVDGRPIAILLQYGHATGTGGYVEGEDYINPALRPIFDQIADSVWKVVTSA